MELIPDEYFDGALTTAEGLLRSGWLAIVGLIGLVLASIVAISLAKNFFQFYNFNVSRNGQTLTIENGLLERKVQKIRRVR